MLSGGGTSIKDSAGAPRVMDRRNFLKLGGFGIAGAALLVTMGEVFAEDSPYSAIAEEFEEAAEEYDVPVAILLAIGFVNTRLEMPPPGASPHEPGESHGRGAYGIMQLVKNDTEDTLGEASRLTGISEEKLKTDRRSNILGGAALLAESQGEKPARLSDWFGAIDGRGGNGKSVEAVAGIGAGDIFASQVFNVLKNGSSEVTPDGEQIDLPAQEEAMEVQQEALEETLEAQEEALEEALEAQEEALEEAL